MSYSMYKLVIVDITYSSGGSVYNFKYSKITILYNIIIIYRIYYTRMQTYTYGGTIFIFCFTLK